VKINPNTQEVTFTRSEVYILSNAPFADARGQIARIALLSTLLPNLAAAEFDFESTPPIDCIPSLFKVE